MSAEKLSVSERAIDAGFFDDAQSGSRAGAQTERKRANAPIEVFAHLAVDKDAVDWRRKREAGDLVGINDPTPYGYGRADDMDCHVTFSRSKKENKLEKFFRLGVRAVLGADLVHAWRNRRAIADAEIVWTHTESQYLAVAMVGMLLRKRVRIIGQSVWLVDSWDSYTPLKKAFFRRLISRVDVMTFLSPENRDRAKALFPQADVRFVKFGIPAETQQAPVERSAPQAVNILALGNDRHRDWKTLIDAVGAMPNASLKILSGSVPKALAKSRGNIEVTRARSNEALHKAFAEATLVCVPLKQNLHASGLTVVQEAILSGVPVVATDIGGLAAYFSADEVRYVPVGDAQALRAAFEEIAADPARAFERASRAQALMAGEARLGAHSYIRQHVELSREILQGKA